MGSHRQECLSLAEPTDTLLPASPALDLMGGARSLQRYWGEGPTGPGMRETNPFLLPKPEIGPVTNAVVLK